MQPPLYFSRRQVLKAGASSLTLAAMARANQSDQADGVALSEPPATVRTRKDSVNRLTIPVRIHGQGPYRFIVDTGADRTVLASEVASELGLTRGSQVVLDGVVRALLTDTVTVRELSLGPFNCRDLNIPILSRALLGADGYLGLDCLDHHRVIFDFKSGLMQVSNPRAKFSATWIQPNEARVHAFGSSGHLRSQDCKVDGVPAAAFIDSGADVSAANTALLDALAHRNPSFRQVGNIELVDITGGQILGKVAMTKKIQLPNLAFDDCPLVMANFQVFKAWGLDHAPALLIGMNLLRQFSKVSIDYGLKEIRFDLTTTAQPRFQNALT